MVSKVMQLAMEQFGHEIDEYYRGSGCRRCRNTGFSGRIAIHELLVIDDEMREMITSKPTTNMVRDYAQRQGMLPLRYDGLRKVKEGITTIEEVFRVSDDNWVPKKMMS